MRKEYADLPPHQKMVYIKQNVIYIGFTLVPTLIWFGLFLGFIGDILPQLETIQAAHNMTQSTHTQTVEEELELYEYFYLGFLCFGMIGIVLGWTTFGGLIGAWINGRLGLYTDIDLEDRQKKLDEIKKKLEQSK